MNHLKLVLLGVLIFAIALRSFPEAREKNPVRVCRDDGSRIDYYLERVAPDARSKELLLVLQGSDCNSVTTVKAIGAMRNVRPESDLLTVEKYGITERLPRSDLVERPDCPRKYLDNDCPERRADDAVRVVSRLVAEYGYERVVVIGGSEGALVAGMVSARSGDVAATVIFGGGGRHFRDDVVHSMRFQYESPEEAERNIAGFNQFADYVLSSGPFPISMSNHGYPWWRSMLSVDQLENLRSIRTPVLIVQGTEDRSSSTEGARAMHTALTREGRKNFAYKQYEGYDHSLNLSAADGSAERVLADIRDWLESAVSR